MKKIGYFLICSFCFLFLWIGCTKTEQTNIRKKNSLNSWMAETGRLKVLSTTAMIGDLVDQIGREQIDQIVLITGDMDPHSYEIVKGDNEKIARAEAVFANGLLLEHSASMQHQLKNHPHSVMLGDMLLKTRPGDFIYVDGQVDPHIWMDISLWAETTGFIAKKLAELDPENKELYRQRAEDLKERLLEKDREIHAYLQEIPAQRRYLVTSHDAFNYFGRRYLALPEERETGLWKERVKALQGLAPEEQISALEIQNIVSHALNYSVRVIFYESNLSRDSLNKVVDACRRMGRPLRLSDSALYGDTLGNHTYEAMLESNAKAIYRAFMEIEDKEEAV